MGWGIELRKTCFGMSTLLSEGEGHITAAVKREADRNST